MKTKRPTVLEPGRSVLVAVFFVAMSAANAFAYRDDYIDETFVYRTVEPGVTEVENWFDFREPHHDSDFFRCDLALERGVTDRFMFSSVVALDTARDGFNYSGSRFEARYRFGEEDPNGISVATSLEFEDDQLDQTDHLTPRLILNRDLKDLNITLNLSPQFELRGRESVAGGYAFGMRYGQKQVVRYGVEIKQAFGGEVLGQVIPQLWIRLPYELDLKIGYAFGFTHDSDNFFRIVIETEFGRNQD
jgi:hypothetical protein